jgi:hypothetical protein
MNEEFDEYEEFDEDMMLDEVTAEAVMSFVKCAAKSANKLTKIIVENNRHNSVKMSTQDIYATFEESFGVAMATMARYGSFE